MCSRRCRYLLLDKLQGDVTTIARSPSNRITAGGYFGPAGSPFSNWMHEALTGLNTYVQYVHTKIMLIDPLGDDPIVITGSANFSEASTTSNDENMLVIRGDTRIADIYLGEFMRLFDALPLPRAHQVDADPSGARPRHAQGGARARHEGNRQAAPVRQRRVGPPVLRQGLAARAGATALSRALRSG